MAIVILYSSFLCVLHFSGASLLCRNCPLIFDVLLSVLVYNPDFFFSIDLRISNCGISILLPLFMSDDTMDHYYYKSKVNASTGIKVFPLSLLNMKICIY